MIKVNSDFDSIKTEMKKMNRAMKEAIKIIKKPYKRNEKMSQEDQLKIEKLGYKVNMCSTSKVIPVKVDGIVINYKIYSSFIKKLDGLKTSAFVQNDGLVVQYWKPGTLNQGKGILKLYDLSSYFMDFQHVPDAVLIDGHSYQ